MRLPGPSTPLLVLLLALLLAAQAPGVRAQDGDDAPPPVDSEDVDREEAEFRRRMELEEKPGNVRTPVPYTPDIIDVVPAPGPLDHLPPESREHLEDQLTELIIANGRWEPADAQQPAPYTPSEAAQSDPALQAEEQAAWAEMVAAYHEREQAALEDARGGAGSGPGQGSGQGTDQGAGPGGAGSSTGGADGQGDGGGTSGSPGSRAPQERTPREARDEAFNALEFLQRQNAGDGQSASDPAPAGATPPQGEPFPPAAEAGSPGSGAGPSQAEPEPSPGSEPAATPATEPAASPETQSVATPSTEPAAPPAADSPATPTSEPATPADAGDTPDGSLPSDALEALFPANDEASPDDAEDPPTVSTPPPAAEPPPTGFLAWLRSLFSPDEPDQDDAPDPGN